MASLEHEVRVAETLTPVYAACCSCGWSSTPTGQERVANDTATLHAWLHRHNGSRIDMGGHLSAVRP